VSRRCVRPPNSSSSLSYLTFTVLSSVTHRTDATPSEAAFTPIQAPQSWHSTTPTPTPTSSPTSSRGSSRDCRRVVQLAVAVTQEIARVGRVGEDPREDVRVGVGVSVGVVEFQLNPTQDNARQRSSTCVVLR